MSGSEVDNPKCGDVVDHILNSSACGGSKKKKKKLPTGFAIQSCHPVCPSSL